MNMLRSRKMTFRKLPTVILFMNGEPVALRSGMGTDSQLEYFLKDNLPWLEDGAGRNQTAVGNAMAGML